MGEENFRFRDVAPALVIFVVVSSKTGFSEHMRYVLPAFPYAFIFVSQLAQMFSPDRQKPGPIA